MTMIMTMIMMMIPQSAMLIAAVLSTVRARLLIPKRRTNPRARLELQYHMASIAPAPLKARRRRKRGRRRGRKVKVKGTETAGVPTHRKRIKAVLMQLMSNSTEPLSQTKRNPPQLLRTRTRPPLRPARHLLRLQPLYQQLHPPTFPWRSCELRRRGT